jgi:glutamyl-tRNA synthetase/glutamyl-Q tRNA(Asp) synthetase
VTDADLAALAARLPAGFATRFAPAPTGFLHLGHVASALLVWHVARELGGRVLLRIEDHDFIRCRPEYETALLDDLEWLGLTPDGNAPRQSDRGARYEAALGALTAAGLVYPCDCSRGDIARDVADVFGQETPYAGRCRARALNPDDVPARRLRMDPGHELFDDARLGPQRQEPASQCGDLLARDRSGRWTYQFAVTVDDMDQGIDLVIRGEDLLASTGRQLRLARLLGRQVPPVYLHHPLVLRPDGAKLSKSNRDTAVRELRDAGLSAREVRALAAPFTQI